MSIVDHLKNMINEDSGLQRPDMSFLNNPQEFQNGKYRIPKINELVDRAIKDGGLIKSHLKKLNELVSNIYDDAFINKRIYWLDELHPQWRDDEDKTNSLLYWSIPSFHNMLGYKKKLLNLRSELTKENLIKLVDRYIDRISEFEGIHNFIQQLKGKVITRVSKSEVEAKEKERVLSTVDGKKIVEILKSYTDQIRDEMIKNSIDFLNKMLDNYLKNRKNNMQSPQMFDKENNTGGRFTYYLDEIIERSRKINGVEYLADKSKIEKVSISRVDSVIEAFQQKNISKLYAIIDQKKNMSSSRIQSLGSGRGYIEGSMIFTFDDGSQFNVHNQIVTVWGRGSPFNRFPTTFHDVKMPDGTFYKMRSEEWMIENFK